MAVTSNDKSGIKSFDDMKGKTVGVAGTFEAIALEKQVKAGAPASSAPPDLCRRLPRPLRGQIDATVSTSTVAGRTSRPASSPGSPVVGKAPFDIDYVALFTNRDEYGSINYLNLFVNQQIRTGRYAALYEKWVGGGVPSLTVLNAYR